MSDSYEILYKYVYSKTIQQSPLIMQNKRNITQIQLK